MRKKETTPSGAAEWTSAPTGRITPADIQQKEFQVARLGAGYRMREVDEFLDQVTDAVSALIAENERLLRSSGDPGSPSGSTSTSTSTGASMRPTTDADRAAVEAFLLREKGFLQDLGGLVQEHAEELRSMVRAARQSAPAAPEAAHAAAPATGEIDDPETPPESVEDADAIGAPGHVTAPDSSEAETSSEHDDQGDDDREDSGPEITETADVEPIRLDGPEPARSGRQDDKEDGSLKELFWGEE